MPEGRGESRVRKHSPAPMLIFGAVSTIVGIVIVLAIHWFPTDASQQAKRIRILYDVLLIVSVPIFVLVLTVILFSVYYFHRRPGEELLDGPPLHGNTRLEVIWTVAPALLIIGLVTYSVTVLYANEAKKKNTLSVDVTARQWAFEFGYPQPGGKEVYSPFLYLPNGRPVMFRIRSLDVIHSFFVPQFSEKIDAVPGITTNLRVTPTRRGIYPIECTELCGAGHALMRSTSYVLTQAQYAKWMSKQPQVARTASGLPPGSYAEVAVPGIPSAFPGTTTPAAATPTTAAPASPTTAAPASPTTAAPATPTTAAPSTPTTPSTTASSGSTAPAHALATGPGTTASAGKAVFNSAGCSGCHTLAAAGATGTIGPNLDTRLPIDCKTRKLAIKTCVLDAVTSPYAFIPPGYSSGIMPSTFASTLGPTKLAAVVNFVASVTK